MSIIYKITCKQNGKAYIGKSENIFEHRYTNGRFWAKTHNQELQDDAYKYGSSSMKVEILVESEKIRGKALEDLENYFINRHNTKHPSGYNKRSMIQEEISPSRTTKKTKTPDMRLELDTIQLSLDVAEFAKSVKSRGVIALHQYIYETTSPRYSLALHIAGSQKILDEYLQLLNEYHVKISFLDKQISQSEDSIADD